MLPREPKTIAEHIECLARLTGAPRSFVLQVKELFSVKGISLRDDAAPYLNALEEACRREESIRETARRARQSVARLRQGFDKIGKAYVRKQSALGSAGGRPSEVAIPGDHRTFVSSQQNDDWPMVPGPDDVQ